MISIARPKNHQLRAARPQGLLVLEPPRHSNLPLAFLGPGKHLIGSGDNCAIRVSAEGVQLHHAMILVGDQTTLLKALDRRTWVNDSVVAEAVLRQGDRLSIGPITFVTRFATPEEARDFVPVVTDERVAPRRAEQATSVDVDSNRPDANGIRLSLDLGSVGKNRSNEAVTPAARVDTLQLPRVSKKTVDLRATEADTDETSVLRVSSEVDHESISTELPTRERPDYSEPDFRREQTGCAGRLTAQQDQLKQLAAELTRQSNRLKERSNQVSEREADLDRKQAQLAVENEKLVTSAQTTRRELAEEYARQMKLWQEWDASYRRTAEELKSQLETVEQRRASIHDENERLARDRADLQRLQTHFEGDRKTVSTERVQAAKELGELQTLRAAFETERRAHLASLQESEAQVVAERRAINALQAELIADRQQFEHDRTLFATERSEESMRREHEVREQTAIRMRLNNEESSLQTMRFELDARRFSHENERVGLQQELASLQRDRDDFESRRAEVEKLRADLNQAEIELNLNRHSQHDLQAKLEATEQETQRQRHECEQLKQTVDKQRVDLESLRTNLRFEQQELESVRTELASLKLHLQERETHFASTLHYQRTHEPADSVAPVSGKPEAYPTLEPAVPADQRANHYPILNPLFDTHEPALPGHPDLNSLTSESLAPVPPPVPLTEWSMSDIGGYSSFGEFDRSPPPIPVEHGVLATRMPQDTSFAANPPMDEMRSLPFDPYQSSLFGNESPVHAEQFDGCTHPTAVTESVDETLLDINQRFGFVPTTLQQELIRSEPLAPPSEPRVVEHDRSEMSLMTANSLIEDSLPSTSPEYPQLSMLERLQSNEGSLSSLRAQLALMFDLTEESVSRSNETLESTTEVADTADELREASALESGAAVEDATDADAADGSMTDKPEAYPTSESLSSDEELEFATEDEKTLIACQVTADSQVVSDDATLDHESEAQEVDPWERRLRELAQVAAPADTVLPPPPATIPEKAEEAAEDEEEFSVEAQLARLLGRPLRTRDNPQDKPPGPENKAPSVSVAAVAQQPQFSTTDRSHLSEEPKHKQNKSAVRDEVQSFRAVAQMSARSALAKHSWKNLRNNVYFSMGLAIASAGATLWYVGTLVSGMDTGVWKSMACALATAICSYRLYTSYAHLTKWRSNASADAKSDSKPRLYVVPGAVEETPSEVTADEETDSDNEH